MQYLTLSIGGNTVKVPQGIQSGGIGTTQHIIQTGITIFLIFVVVLALIFMVFAGIRWIMSGGDKSALDAAKTQLRYAIIGLIIALAAYVIVNVITGFFSIHY